MNTNLSSLYTEIDTILFNVVCKEEMRAREASSADSEFYYGEYVKAVKQQDSLYDYTISLQLFHSIIPRIPASLAQQMIDGLVPYEDHLTEKEINSLLAVVRADRIENYEETNNYYRMLMGLPDYGTPEEDFIYYKGHPIHELPVNLYYECKTSGYLDVMINKNQDKPYLWYIGKDIDNIYAREAGQFDILWTASGSMYTRFRECYNKERLVFLQTIHSEYLCETMDYTEARELTTLKLQAILLYKLESNSSELDKVEFTKEEAAKIWAEFGLSFPKDMLESYRNTTTFLLNYLRYAKGTNKVMEYISEKLFSGIKLYKYFIRKTHNSNLTFPLPEGTTEEDFYNIEFILRPYYATNIVDFKDNNLDEKILTYDEVVAMDPKWRDTKELREHIFSSDFSYGESKYLSLDNFVDLSEFTNTFTVLIRLLVEHRSVLETQDIKVPITGKQHDAFSVLVYYLGLITRFIEGKNVKIPDSLEDARKLYGFKIPDNIQELRIKFAWFFTQSDYDWLLDEFPDAINDDDSFFNFIVNTDKVVGLESYMYDLLNSCKNWVEYDLAESLFRLVKIVNRTPSSYDTEGSVDGFTYADWLFENDSELYEAYSKVISSKELFTIEIDSITQTLIDFFNTSVDEKNEPTNITTVITSFNIIMNGVSKYLMYILNLFKSYSCEFLNESVAYYFGEKYNTLHQISNIRIDGHYDVYTFENNSDWDGVIVQKELPYIRDSFIQDIDVILSTPFGSVKINNQGGEDNA